MSKYSVAIIALPMIAILALHVSLVITRFSYEIISVVILMTTLCVVLLSQPWNFSAPTLLPWIGIVYHNLQGSWRIYLTRPDWQVFPTIISLASLSFIASTSWSLVESWVMMSVVLITCFLMVVSIKALMIAEALRLVIGSHSSSTIVNACLSRCSAILPPVFPVSSIMSLDILFSTQSSFIFPIMPLVLNFVLCDLTGYRSVRATLNTYTGCGGWLMSLALEVDAV